MPLDVQAKSLTNRLVPVLWACHPGSDVLPEHSLYVLSTQSDDCMLHGRVGDVVADCNAVHGAVYGYMEPPKSAKDTSDSFFGITGRLPLSFEYLARGDQENA
jgi:hypothetical protein